MSADSAAWNKDESMVAVAVRIRVCTGFLTILRGKTGILAHHGSVGLADLARQFLDLAVGVRELDRIPRPQKIQALADPGRLRMAARSAGSSAMRLKMASRVSFRPTTTMVAATLACCIARAPLCGALPVGTVVTAVASAVPRRVESGAGLLGRGAGVSLAACQRISAALAEAAYGATVAIKRLKCRANFKVAKRTR